MRIKLRAMLEKLDGVTENKLPGLGSVPVAIDKWQSVMNSPIS